MEVPNENPMLLKLLAGSLLLGTVYYSSGLNFNSISSQIMYFFPCSVL